MLFVHFMSISICYNYLKDTPSFNRNFAEQLFEINVSEYIAGVYKDYCILMVYSEKCEKVLKIIPSSFLKNQYWRQQMLIKG